MASKSKANGGGAAAGSIMHRKRKILYTQCGDGAGAKGCAVDQATGEKGPPVPIHGKRGVSNWRKRAKAELEQLRKAKRTAMEGGPAEKGKGSPEVGAGSTGGCSSDQHSLGSPTPRPKVGISQVQGGEPAGKEAALPVQESLKVDAETRTYVKVTVTDPRTSEFQVKLRREKDAESDCDVCLQGGSVLQCDTCPKVYHQDCMSHTVSDADQAWVCPRCVETLVFRKISAFKAVSGEDDDNGIMLLKDGSGHELYMAFEKRSTMGYKSKAFLGHFRERGKAEHMVSLSRSQSTGTDPAAEDVKRPYELPAATDPPGGKPSGPSVQKSRNKLWATMKVPSVDQRLQHESREDIEAAAKMASVRFPNNKTTASRVGQEYQVDLESLPTVSVGGGSGANVLGPGSGEKEEKNEEARRRCNPRVAEQLSFGPPVNTEADDGGGSAEEGEEEENFTKEEIDKALPVFEEHDPDLAAIQSKLELGWDFKRLAAFFWTVWRKETPPVFDPSDAQPPFEVPPAPPVVVEDCKKEHRNDKEITGTEAEEVMRTAAAAEAKEAMRLFGKLGADLPLVQRELNKFLKKDKLLKKHKLQWGMRKVVEFHNTVWKVSVQHQDRKVTQRSKLQYPKEI